MRTTIVTIAYLLIYPVLLAQQIFNNDSVLKMVQMGFPEDMIVTAINHSPGTYDTSINGLISLKKAGVSDSIAAAMARKSGPSSTPAVVDNLMGAYKQFRDSVVTVLAEYGPGKGTGFIIDPAGLVLTNEHVVSRSSWVAVQVNEQSRVRATVLARDPEKDVAVLRINVAKLPSMKSVNLLRVGDSSVEEGERVFTIGSPLHQSKIMTTGIVSKVEDRVIFSDININHGKSGGPLFNSNGIVIGLTTFGDLPAQSAGPGISGIIRIEQAYPVIIKAKAAMLAEGPPSADLLPIEPSDSFPLSVLKERATDRKFKITPYAFNAGDYQVALMTPILTYRERFGASVQARDAKNNRNRKSAVAIQNTFEPLDDLKGWEEYLGERQPVLWIKVSPMLAEGFWSAVGRGMAESHGYVPGPAKLHFKTDFYRMRLLCGEEEVQPIWPGKGERVIAVNNEQIRMTDATFVGLYEYPASAIRSNCGKVTLVVYSEREPDRPLVHTVDSKSVQAVASDFAPYFQQRSATPNLSLLTSQH
jgi:hypothetical protein